MAIREFTDSAGVVWRVWDVTVDQIHPATRGEDFMGELQDGWLAFESDGERRRIGAPYPTNWTELSVPELEALCRSAMPGSHRRAGTMSGEYRAFTAVPADRTAVATGERTFTSPRGREWLVRPHERTSADGRREVVLRFTSGDSCLDLVDWPEGWRTASLKEYAMMMLDADPPRRVAGDAPQRRRDDRPAEKQQQVAAAGGEMAR